MALNDMRGLSASTPGLSNANPVRPRSDDAVREVTRRPDAGADFAQVMAERHAQQLASERSTDAAASARREENSSAAARDAGRNNEAQQSARNNDNDSNSNSNTGAEPSAGNAAAAAVGGGASSGASSETTSHGASGAVAERTRGQAGDDSDAASADAASAAAAALLGPRDFANTLAVSAAINPAAAALAAANANGAAAAVPSDATAGSARAATDGSRSARASLRAGAALIGGETTGAAPSERAGRDLAGDLAAATRDNRGGTNVAADAKRGNVKQDSRPDVVVDALAIAADAPRAAAGVRDRLLEDFEQRFSRVLNAAAEAAGRGDGHHALASGVNPVATAAAPPVLTASIATPVTQPGFGDALGDRVVMFAQQRVVSAQITVTPADLGPVTIAIEMHGQDASLNFTAAHPATRAAIEDSLPRLRDMFANNGLNLSQANVGGETRRDPGRPQRGTHGGNQSDRARPHRPPA